MENGNIRITRIVFTAFNRECVEVFYNREIDECKLIIWKYYCNTAVFKSIEQAEAKFIIESSLFIEDKELSSEKYEPKDSHSEELQKLKK